MSTGKKTPGRFKTPPAQKNFDKLPLGNLSKPLEGTFYRLHSLNAATGAPRDPLHFSVRGTSRFDPISGVGTLYLAEDLAGAMMEVFDDRWGPVGSLGRSVTRQELKEWWVTLVNVPSISSIGEAGSSHLAVKRRWRATGAIKRLPRQIRACTVRLASSGSDARASASHGT